jgi:cytosine/adenosine deaminase-related metal-dependent hydrolase
MIVVEGGWLLTMTGEPVRGGRLAIVDGRIVAAGETLADREPDLRLPGAILMPGLVNAHTHLELSYLAGAVPPSEAFVPWVRTLLAARAAVDEMTSPEVDRAADAAARAMRASGTAVVGDVSNTLRTPALLARHGLSGVVFHELLGFGAADRAAQVREARARADAAVAPDVRTTLAPHAPYSVSRELMAAIRDDLAARPDAVSTVHVAEGQEEVEFVRTGQGPWRGMLDRLGVWNESWKAPGTSPIAYLDDLGVFDGRTLAVHGVQADGPDLARLRASSTTLVSCPRSNRWVGAGNPPIDAFYASHVRVAFGTDSLASTPDLNLFAELAEARRLAPRVPARWLLEGATVAGASALGCGDAFGTLEPGKRAAVLAVRVPEGVADPEQYLLTGIEPDAVSWVDVHG